MTSEQWGAIGPYIISGLGVIASIFTGWAANKLTSKRLDVEAPGHVAGAADQLVQTATALLEPFAKEVARLNERITKLEEEQRAERFEFVNFIRELLEGIDQLVIQLKGLKVIPCWKKPKVPEKLWKLL